MAQKHLLTAAFVTGAALGLTGQQIALIGLAHASVDQPRPAQGSAIYTVAQAKAATGLQMANAACASINTSEGLTGGDACTIADLTSFCLFFNDGENPGKVKLVGNAALSGDWTRRAP